MVDKPQGEQRDVAVATDENLVDVNLALEGHRQELDTSLLKTAKAYKNGVFLSLLMGLVIIMRDYDISIVGTFPALPAFRNRYGHPVAGDIEAGNQISSRWQVALGVAALVGQVVGSFLVTIPMERFGRRPTLLVSLCLTTCLIFMQFFSPSIEVLTASEYLSGIVFGFYQVLIPTFASELMPTQLRPFLTAYIDVCYGIGGLISNGIVKGFDLRSDQWAYRIPFAIQWIWPAICFPVVFISPESPWWLLRQGRVDSAKSALKQLAKSGGSEINLEQSLEMMKKTIILETFIDEDTGSYRDCLTGTALRRTEIATMIFICQDFAGMFLSPSYFFEQVGMTTSQAYDMSLGISGAKLFFTLVSIFFVIPYFSRRKIFFYGLSCCSAFLLLSGIMACVPQTGGARWTQGVLLLLCDVVFGSEYRKVLSRPH
jgi:SP family general alpha glucoside:H+ symporter-like MFS transporter